MKFSWKTSLDRKHKKKRQSTLTQRILEICSNLIKEAGQSKQKRGEKSNETSNNTGMCKERQGNAQRTMHKANEKNTTKQTEETRAPNNSVHRGKNIEKNRTKNANFHFQF